MDPNSATSNTRRTANGMVGLCFGQLEGAGKARDKLLTPLFQILSLFAGVVLGTYISGESASNNFREHLNFEPSFTLVGFFMAYGLWLYDHAHIFELKQMRKERLIAFEARLAHRRNTPRRAAQGGQNSIISASCSCSSYSRAEPHHAAGNV